MVRQIINNLEFELREYQDFSWLNNYGDVFDVIVESFSGCICFGIENGNNRYFYKVAGGKIIDGMVSESESIKLLKDVVLKYKDIKHDNLIKYIDSFEYKVFFVVIFEYIEGVCLVDHLHFDGDKKTKEITPMMHFKTLSIGKRLNVVSKLFSFFEDVIDNGYVAVNFSDSNIFYDFITDNVTFCNIDLFRKIPTFNDMGCDYYGIKRLKAYEENILNAVIDERTNVFTLGAIIMDFFSNVTNIDKRYDIGMFVPNKFEEFELGREVFNVLVKATCYDRHMRYNTIKEFECEFNNAVMHLSF